MKKLLFVFVVILGMQSALSAQVSKTDIDQIMKELGTNQDKITTFYIGNTLVFYKDGSHKRTYEKYSKVNGSYGNSVKIEESGIMLKTTKDGKLHGMKLFPYKSINTIYVGADYLEIYLKD